MQSKKSRQGSRKKNGRDKRRAPSTRHEGYGALQSLRTSSICASLRRHSTSKILLLGGHDSGNLCCRVRDFVPTAESIICVDSSRDRLHSTVTALAAPGSSAPSARHQELHFTPVVGIPYESPPEGAGEGEEGALSIEKASRQHAHEGAVVMTELLQRIPQEEAESIAAYILDDLAKNCHHHYSKSRFQSSIGHKWDAIFGS